MIAESRWHKHVMAVSKTILVLLTVIITTGLITYVIRFYRMQSNSQLMMIMDILRNKDTIIAPTLTGRTKGGDNYTIEGSVAHMKGHNKERIEIENPIVHIKPKEGKEINVRGDTGDYFINTGRSIIKHNVTLTIDDYTFLLKSLDYNLQSDDMESKESLSGGNDAIQIKAKNMNYQKKKDWMHLGGYAVMTMQQPNKEPITLEGSESISLDNAKQVIIARKNARLHDGDKTVSGYWISLWLKNNNQLEHLEAKGQVVINNADSKATGTHFVYDTEQEEGILIGQPVYITMPTRTIVAKKQLTYHGKSNSLLATGGVTIQEDPYTMKGDTARIILASENTKEKDVESIEFFDHVQLDDGDTKMTGDYALYIPQDSMLHITADTGKKTYVQKQDGIVESCGLQINMETKITILLPCSNTPIQGVMQEKMNP